VTEKQQTYQMRLIRKTKQDNIKKSTDGNGAAIQSRNFINLLAKLNRALKSTAVDKTAQLKL